MSSNKFKIIEEIKNLSKDEKITLVKENIYDVHDYIPNIVFKDLTPILLNPKAYQASLSLLLDEIKHMNVDAIAGVESKGYWWGIELSQTLNIPFIPVRKKNKLPRETISIDYKLEYGKDSIEVHKDDIKNLKNAVIVDDLVATGGTMIAATKLFASVGVKTEACLCLVELVDIHGRKTFDKEGIKLISVFTDIEHK